MRKTIKLSIILLLTFYLTGCWDSINLEDLLIVYSLGIDVSETDTSNYNFTIGFPTIIEEAPEKKMSVSVESPSLGNGKTKLQQKVYRELSYDAIKVIIFSEEVAREGILFHIDSMLREPLFRGTTRFAAAKNRASDLIELKPDVSLFISEFIFDSIQQNYDDTTVPISTIRNFSNQYYTFGIEPSMPFISCDSKNNELVVNSVALFKGDKMIYELKEDNSRAFMLLKGEIHKGIYTFNYVTDEYPKKEFVSININGGTSKIKTELIDSQLHIFHDITVSCDLGEYTPTQPILSKSKLSELNNYLSIKVKEELENTLEVLQKELKNDNIGYGLYVKANHPSYFNKEDWNNQFSKAIIHVNPKVILRTIGVSS